jgi:PIN domain nuclease of toxin-antitoxin system
MKLLLDTHAFIWFVEGDPQLSAMAAAAIASPLEISIKVAKGKLAQNLPPGAFIQRWTSAYGMKELEIQTRHALMAGALDPIHGDPFDRLLIAQVICEEMHLVIRDSKLANYQIPIIW